MQRVLISIPDTLAMRMRAAIPAKKRSRVIASLIEHEVKMREQALRRCAQAVEKDAALAKELQDWDLTLLDGLESDDKAR
ncbi:MAG: hypothetical protein GY821_13810 [Gammaproteobacteria bacterium]|nr:hypothetical protein [Gammaproteobacteria bacterium]